MGFTWSCSRELVSPGPQTLLREPSRPLQTRVIWRAKEHLFRLLIAAWTATYISEDAARSLCGAVVAGHWVPGCHVGWQVGD